MNKNPLDSFSKINSIRLIYKNLKTNTVLRRGYVKIFVNEEFVHEINLEKAKIYFDPITFSPNKSPYSKKCFVWLQEYNFISKNENYEDLSKRAKLSNFLDPDGFKFYCKINDINFIEEEEYYE